MPTGDAFVFHVKLAAQFRQTAGLRDRQRFALVRFPKLGLIQRPTDYFYKVERLPHVVFVTLRDAVELLRHRSHLSIDID